MQAPQGMPAEDQLILRSTYGGKSFQEQFYSFFDTKRSEVFRFFKEESVLIYNGNPANGLQNVRDAFNGLPATKHEISSVDAQPICVSVCANSLPLQAPSIIVTVYMFVYIQ